MGLPAGQYSMQCWNSTVQPDKINRPHLLYQSFQLIKALQKRFTNGEIAIPSTDSKAQNKDLEICILYRTGTNLFADIANFLTETAQSLGLDYKKFAKQDAGITRYFSQQEIDNVSYLGKPVPDDLTEEKIAKTIDQAQQLKAFRTNDSWKKATKPEQRASPFMLPRSTLQRLHKVEGEDLAKEIRSILDAINAANAKTKTSTSVISMIAKGAVCIFGGGELAGSAYCVMILWTAGFTAAAIASAGVLIAALGGFFAGAYLTLKDASNVLLVVNDTPNDLLPRMEHIENGDRRVVPEMIPAATPNADFVPCGLFFYSKYAVGGFPFGTYGSAFGVSFDSNPGNFSIGMDCPNSLFGGNNSIEVHNREHAHDACKMALNSGCMHGWCNKPYVDVKIASHWGNVNYGRAVVMKDN